VVVERWLLVDESGLLGGSYWSEAVVAYGFEEGGFSRAVFSGEEDDAGVDRDLGEESDGGDGERVGGPVFYSFAEEGIFLSMTDPVATQSIQHTGGVGRAAGEKLDYYAIGAKERYKCFLIACWALLPCRSSSWVLEHT